jgi:hypothetical protein
MYNIVRYLNEEIKEVQEPTSSKGDSDNDERENSHYPYLFKAIPNSTKEMKNPFIMHESSSCSSKHKETP